MNWQYVQPTKIIFGNDTIQEITKHIEGKRGLLITSPSFERRGYVDKLKMLSNQKIVHVYSETSPNTDYEDCMKCLHRIGNKPIDFIIALGGGSVIDLAKIISVAVLNEHRDWLESGVDIPSSSIPVIAIPTTAGTGSEVTCVSVVSNHKKGTKKPLVSHAFYPKLAIVDPMLTHSLPPYITACSGMDVLCHALESYWSKHHQPISDALAIHAITLVIKYLSIVVHDPLDKVAREKMSEASLIAGLAFQIPKTTSMHACSYPLTNILNIPHGEACALTMEYFIEFNHQHGCERVLELVNTIGFKEVATFIKYIQNLKEEIGMLTHLENYEITDDVLECIIKDCQNGNLLNNPIEVSEKDIRDLFKKLMEKGI
ncbi:iron-containing alcohol dehydrogenase family protein [Amedibacillus sp. YH-ame6]